MQTMRLTMPMLCLALVAAIATASRTHDEASIARAASPAPSAEVARADRRPGAAALGAGDRLRIAFHETIDIPGGTPGGREDADSMPRMFYQRADLSGEYTIDEEGVVSLPLLGRFQVTGLSPRDLEDQLKTAFMRATGRPGDVTVAIQDRWPVYVVGAVRVPGAVKHAGHMTVLQAIALAGGLDRGNAAELMEGVREQERVGKLTRLLERLLARRVRQAAERTSDVTMQAPQELIARAGKDRAEALITAERTLLELDQSRREQQRAEALAGLSTLHKEIEAMRAKLVQLDAASRIQGEHLDELRKLEGLATRTSLVRTRSEMAEIEARRQDTHAALADAEGRLAQGESALARESLDHAAELARSMAATEDEIADVRGALDAAELLADPLGRGGLVTARGGAAARPVYEIVRQGADGPAVLTAQESTPLSPGDVLKIRLEAASQAEGEPRLSQHGKRAVSSMDAERIEMRKVLAGVARWGCQYQKIDLQAIAASRLDLIVIDPIVDIEAGRAPNPEEMQLLKRKPNGGRRLVLAYLSVGAAEEYRPYWSPRWRDGPAPEWLGSESLEWSRSYSVRYWHPEWQRIVLDAAVRLSDAGFDGIFLDRVDAFQDWSGIRSSAMQDMADLVAKIAQATRSRNSGFLLVGQNAEPLLASKQYLDAIDGVSKESLLTGLKGQGAPNSNADIEWSLRYLRRARDAGLTIFAIEYLDNASLVAAAASEYLRLGFVPFFGNRLLDRLP